MRATTRPIERGALAERLIAWYRQQGRTLPWRDKAAVLDPYRVWLSEIMLQQTTVATVIPYYERFLARWPDVISLAAAELDDVLHAWQGLGYYARARNLHKCARVVAGERAGRFPTTERELLTLPGIGAYTAAAIAAIAFDEPATVVDGNVERVITRLRGIDAPLPGARREVRDAARVLTPQSGAGDHAQAIMDLGATLCTPRNPGCERCPWRADCVALAMNMVDKLPRRTSRAAKPTRRGVVYWIERAGSGGNREVLLRRRPENGLLGGMMEFPSAGWSGKEQQTGEPPVKADWSPVDGLIRHTFTHFHLELEVRRASVDRQDLDGGRWWPVERLSEQALPTVMKKVARLVLE